MTAQRTLVISPNWIGDAVMAQPLLQLLKAAHPERPIDVLAPPPVAPVWRQMAEVDDVMVAPFRHGPLQLKERWRYARELRRRGYADAYVLPNTLKYALIPWLAGIARRVGYKGESRYGLINVMHHDDVPPRPMVPFYAALALPPVSPLPAAQRAAAPRPRMRLSDGQVDAAWAKAGLDPARPMVAFAPGAEFGSAKRWPPAYFAQLAREIFAAHPDAQVALLGSPKDRETCDTVVSEAGAPAGLHNLAGATSLSEAVALIARAGALVTNDSGLMHVAAALDRHVVAIYGPTDPRHTPPSSELAQLIWLHLECSPCQKRECPLGHQDCMRKIAPQQVWQTLQPMLAVRT